MENKKITIEITVGLKDSLNLHSGFKIADMNYASLELIANITSAIRDTNIPDTISINSIKIN
jgi:hypothetical protein